MSRQAMFVTQVFVRPEINRKAFEQAFLKRFPGARFRFGDLPADAHDGDKMYELTVPNEHSTEVLPWFRGYWLRLGYGTKVEPASGFGFSHSG